MGASVKTSAKHKKEKMNIVTATLGEDIEPQSFVHISPDDGLVYYSSMPDKYATGFTTTGGLEGDLTQVFVDGDRPVQIEATPGAVLYHSDTPGLSTQFPPSTTQELAVCFGERMALKIGPVIGPSTSMAVNFFKI